MLLTAVMVLTTSQNASLGFYVLLFSVFLFRRVRVLLQVKVGIEFTRDHMVEILQFENYHERDPFLEN